MKPNYQKILPLTFIFCVCFSLCFSQKKAMKNTLCKKWVFTKYKIMGVEYDLTQEKSPDILNLYNNNTFEALEEGRELKGKWKYVAGENMIVLTNIQEEVIKMMKIEKVKEKEMVCSIVTDWQYDMTVFMTTESKSLN
jgi:hypothetical protein